MLVSNWISIEILIFIITLYVLLIKSIRILLIIWKLPYHMDMVWLFQIKIKIETICEIYIHCKIRQNNKPVIYSKMWCIDPLYDKWCFIFSTFKICWNLTTKERSKHLTLKIVIKKHVLNLLSLCAVSLMYFITKNLFSLQEDLKIRSRNYHE